ncbi:M1 family metallopeptidase [Streptomyces sp. NBC_01142]|uniref:M1 family metallopeptidase n=1 Tax=Streptomyces sp. NBC_01142 TaxID=2975865 RepID=UPI0022590431|nr:M1 family metallopeptidase [Streptomyces sp. NBC_01142]MCX4818599.1 M1 family metallopeptidase [Streptomyces sp. NBC_01142]
MTDSYLPQLGDSGYRTTEYDLELDYRPYSGRLTARARISAVAERELTEVALDLGPFRIGRVLVDGVRPARYTHRADKLRVRPARRLRAGSSFTVEVRYTGVPRPVRTRDWGDLGWEQLEEGALVASQPSGARSWFPCNDRPDDKAVYRMAVTTPSPYTVVANGTLTSRTISASTTTWVYEQPAPMAAYLATVQIGLYDLVDVEHPGPVPQPAAVPRHLLTRFGRDFARQPQMMTAFTDLFGPYPFEDYGVVVVDEELDVPVEAQGVSIFGANHVDGRRGSERLVAHELAHQWFGNSLTVADWRHIWLNEGFAKYAEWLWSEVSGGPSAAALAAKSRDRLSVMAQDLRIGDPGLRRLFDDRVYQRGALTLHALRTVIGHAAFVAVLREWTATYRHSTVTTEEFIALAQRHSAHPLDGLFTMWLYDEKLPALPQQRL